MAFFPSILFYTLYKENCYRRHVWKKKYFLGYKLKIIMSINQMPIWILNDDSMCWQERAELLLLRYASRWARHFVRRRLDLVIDSQDRNRSITGLSVPPRHCVSARCPCQFIEDHLKYKPRGKLTLSRFFFIPDFNLR